MARRDSGGFDFDAVDEEITAVEENANAEPAPETEAAGAVTKPGVSLELFNLWLDFKVFRF